MKIPAKRSAVSAPLAATKWAPFVTGPTKVIIELLPPYVPRPNTVGIVYANFVIKSALMRSHGAWGSSAAAVSRMALWHGDRPRSYGHACTNPPKKPSTSTAPPMDPAHPAEFTRLFFPATSPSTS